MTHSLTKIAMLALLAFGTSVTGCAHLQSSPVAGERRLHTPSDQLTARIDSIILHRRAPFGPGVNYTVSFARDGRAEYRGRPSMSSRFVTSFAGREGVYEGLIDVRTFNALALVMQELGFMERPPPYPPLIDAAETVVILVASGDRVTHRGHLHDPPEIWLIGEAIDGMLEKIRWREVSAR